MPPEPLSVTELTRDVRQLLEDRFEGIWVAGEIGNLGRPPSGHLYLTLKDEGAALKAVMFRFAARKLDFRPREGDQVLAFGSLTVYPARGDYQLKVTRMVPQGLGKLQQRFEELRARLEKEGLFRPDRKRPLPFLPRRIALVTSPTGAAVHDMLRVLHRRYPGMDVVVIPTRVQGRGAELEIAAALDRVGELEEVDLVLAGRGGGSLEDLWCFNEEAVARALFRCPVPVMSAVGHEVDYTIADFVADARAPTPSAAAELAVPDRAELERRLVELRGRLQGSMSRQLGRLRERLARLARSRALRDPMALVEAKSQRVDELSERLRRAMVERMRRHRDRLEATELRLQAVGPQRVLERGFALLTRPGENAPLRDPAQVRPGEALRAQLAGGELDLVVAGGPPPPSTPPRRRRSPAPSHPAQGQLFAPPPNPPDQEAS